ncbi:CHAT domain-containing protein [Asanoa sp. NPDC049573]|uniref:CHAT domain-containing protein n=1 Tax=Asanoa sp. NPDC049573 TaxID=3155396 RepID=UPI0034161385
MDVASSAVRRSRPVRVFISYAHESDEHVEAVRQLWIMLRTKAGVDAVLDIAESARRTDWPLWMQREATAADFVVVVASPAYKRRSEPDAAADDGRGVQFEAALMRELIYTDRQAWMPRVLPVLLAGRSADDLPLWLGPRTLSTYRVDSMSVEGAESLIRTILNRPAHVAPDLGSEPDLPMLTGPATLPDAGTAASGAVGLRSEVRIEVNWRDGQLRSRTTLAGATAERTSRLPLGVVEAWVALPLDGAATAERLAEAGRRLTDAIFGEAGLADLAAVVDGSGFGSAVDVAVIADDLTASLPFELLQLPGGRPLVLAPGVTVTRRLADAMRSSTPSLPGPLKILAAIAAPFETRTKNAPLDVEAEMQAILDAVAGVEGSQRAQVTILEVGSLEQIEKALNEAQYHVLHLSAHGSPTSVELENEDGDPVQVDADELVDTLGRTSRPLPLIVLSACAGAAQANGLAATLVRRGADRVIAMLSAVTDDYATELAAALYETLAGKAKISVAAALAHARRSVEARYTRAARAGGRVRQPEYGIATLLAAGDDPPLIDTAAEEAPLAEPTLPPPGGAVRELPLGYLIGRRPELRTVLSVLRGTPAATDRFGATAGVVITGIGGIGKTALAGRAISRIRRQGWLVVVQEGRFNPPHLFAETAKGISHVPQLVDVAATLAGPGDDAVKLKIVEGLLAQARLLLVFDDFEQNLTDGCATFRDDTFQEIFSGLCRAANRGRLLITSRYPMPDDTFLANVHLPGLTVNELRRLFTRLPALRTIPSDDQQLVMATIGGHPRLIEFVDALLRDGRSNLRPVTGKLRELAKQHGLSVTGHRTPIGATTQAMLLGSRDILLDQLLDLLTAAQHDLLLQAAISTASLDATDLALAVHGSDITLDRQRATVADARRLTNLTLLSPAPSGRVTVHPWLRDALQSHQGDQRSHRHERALDMHLRRLKTGGGTYDDLAEACRHLAALQRYEELTGLAISAAQSGIGAAAIAALLAETVAAIPTIHRGHSLLLEREAMALFATGHTRAGAERLHRNHVLIVERGDADPDSVEAQRDLSVSHNRLGDLAIALGDTRTATTHYQTALITRQRLADADPDNAVALRDLSVSHEKLGGLAVAVGDTGTATTHYQTALAIAQRLADADRGNAQAQRDLSVSHNRLGDLAIAVGDTRTATIHHQADLSITQRLADADPDNAQAQRDLSISHNRLGDLAMALGDTRAATTHHRAALAIAQRLADADPDNAQAQRDLSISHEKLGNLANAVGDTPTATAHYQTTLIIRQRLADADPGNAQAQRDLSVSHEKLGNVAIAVGDTRTAATHYQATLTIRQRLADAGPGNAQAQRDLSVSHNRLGDLAIAVGDTRTATTHYRTDLAIAQRLADADPDNAQAQGDLSISHEKLGNLANAVDDTPTATTHYQTTLTIRQRLADADPGNAQAQRDLSISHEKLGNLAHALGDTPVATTHYRAALSIRHRLADADPDNAQLRRELDAVREKFNESKSGSIRTEPEPSPQP